MRAGRPRHIHLRRSKSKQKHQRPSKNCKVLAHEMSDDDEVNQVEPTHSLLLASLRLWEVERDLIEERVAAIVR
jgi:cytosine/adenosine deaminase-related metal-dependent hydrolase